MANQLTVYPNGIKSFLVDSNATAKKEAYTVVITTDSGSSFTNGETDGVVFTMPAIAIGNTVTFYNTARDGAAETSVSPDAADGITYAGSSTDDKDLINTKSTSKYGDFVTLASLDGTDAWQVVSVRGIWEKEA